jgi:hypothetical protein
VKEVGSSRGEVGSVPSERLSQGTHAASERRRGLHRLQSNGKHGSGLEGFGNSCKAVNGCDLYVDASGFVAQRFGCDLPGTRMGSEEGGGEEQEREGGSAGWREGCKC